MTEHWSCLCHKESKLKEKGFRKRPVWVCRSMLGQNMASISPALIYIKVMIGLPTGQGIVNRQPCGLDEGLESGKEAEYAPRCRVGRFTERCTLYLLTFILVDVLLMNLHIQGLDFIAVSNFAG